MDRFTASVAGHHFFRNLIEDHRTKTKIHVRIFAIIVGLAIAAIGGMIAYRAYFLEPSSAVIITSTEVRELPNTARVIGGLALIIVGAVMAFLAARARKL